MRQYLLDVLYFFQQVKLTEDSAPAKIKNKTNDVDSNPNALVDDRFAALFQREEFQQDSTSSEYLLRNPTATGRGRAGGSKQYGSDEEDEDDLYRDDNGDAAADVDVEQEDDEDAYDDNNNVDDSDDDDDTEVSSLFE